MLWLLDLFKAFYNTLITGAQQIGQFVAAGFMQVVDGIKHAIDFLAEAYTAFQNFTNSVIAVFQAMGSAIASIFSGIVDSARSAISFASSAVDKVKGGIGGVAEFFGLGGSSDGVDSANQQLAIASSAPTNSITSNAISNTANKTSETSVQTGDIIVQTQATDAQGISKDIGSNLSDQLKGLEMESATGVDR